MGRPGIICAGGAGSSGGPGVQDLAEGMEKWKMEMNGYLGTCPETTSSRMQLWKSENRLRKKTELIAGGQWNPGRGATSPADIGHQKAAYHQPAEAARGEHSMPRHAKTWSLSPEAFFWVHKLGREELPSWELTYPPKMALLKMIFLFPRWDMLIPWRVSTSCRENQLIFGTSWDDFFSTFPAISSHPWDVRRTRGANFAIRVESSHVSTSWK